MQGTDEILVLVLLVVFVFPIQIISGDLPDPETLKTVKCSVHGALFYNGLCIRCILRKSEMRRVNFNNSEMVNCPVDGTRIDEHNLQKSATFLNGRTIRVVTIERQPFVKIHKELNHYSGVCFELFYTLQNKYNFSRKIFLPFDGNWGSPLPNGSWTGMVGLVQRNVADIGVAGFSVTFGRSKVVQFTDSFHQEPTAILIPPPTQGEKLSVLVRPLSKAVWLGVGLTIFILVPTFYFMHIITLKIRRDESYKDVGTAKLVGHLVQFLTAALIQEHIASPLNKTSRFLVVIWWMVTLVISNIYVGYLVSYLSVPILQNLIDGLDEMVKSDLKWTFRTSSALQLLFKANGTTGVYKLVGDGVNDDDLVQTDYEGPQKVLTGKFCFIKEKSFLDVALANDFRESRKCRMTLAKRTFFKVETALITAKNSPLLPVFNDGISWAVSTGLMERFKAIHWPRDSYCEDAVNFIPSIQPKTRKLNLEDVQSSFLILGLGLVIAITTFFGEKLRYSSSGIRRFRISKKSFSLCHRIGNMRTRSRWKPVPRSSSSTSASDITIMMSMTKMRIHHPAPGEGVVAGSNPQLQFWD